MYAVPKKRRKQKMSKKKKINKRKRKVLTVQRACDVRPNT